MKARALSVPLPLLVIGLTLHGAAAPADDPPDVTIDGGQSVQMCADCSPRLLRLAVTPKDGFKAPENEQPLILEARFGNVSDEALADAFTPSWELAPDRTPLALKIQVDPAIKRPGDYDLILSITPKTRPAAPRLKLKVVLPAAQLELPEKLIVSRVVHWPFSVSLNTPSLIAREASGKARLTGMRAQPRTSTWNGFPVSGQVAIQPLDLAPDSTETLRYELEGEFPLGVVMAPVRFFAPELAQPASLAIEVHSRLPKFYLFLAILAGLLVGFLVKVRLADTIQLGKAQEEANRVLTAVRDDLATNQDKDFKAALEPKLDQLATAAKKKDAAAISTAAKELDTLWRAEIQELGKRRKTAQAAFDALRLAAERPWDVPRATADVLHQAAASLRKIEDLLSHNNVSDAKDETARLLATLCQEARKTTLAWQFEMVQHFETTAAAKAGLPAPILAELAEALKLAKPKLTRIDPSRQPEKTAELEALLVDLSGEFRTAKDLLSHLRTRLEAFWTEVAKTVDPLRSQMPKPNLFDTLRDEYLAFVKETEGAASDPKTATHRLQARLQSLQGLWRKALTGQVAAPSQDLKDLVDQQSFVEAASRMAGELTGNPVLGGKGTAPTTDGAWAPGPGSAPETLTLITSSSFGLRTPLPREGLQLVSMAGILAAKITQTLLLLVLLALWVYSTQAAEFKGTWGELSTVFFIALAVDITVEGLMGKLGQAK